MISIVTPSLNQGKYIERTIQSVLSQSIPGLEYIVVDGGSDDETLTILKNYSAHLQFISEADKGQAHAVNKALKLTTHDIIGWINSDDIYYPNAFQEVLTFFIEHPDIDVVYGKANHIDENDLLIKPYPTQPWDLKKLKQTCFLSQPAVFFRRRVIDHYGLLDEKLNYCMDYEYWLRLALKGTKFVFLEKILAGSRLYPETKTLSSPEKATREAVLMLYKKLDYVPVSWLINDAIVNVKKSIFFKKTRGHYILAVLGFSIVAAFRWNGFFRGLLSCLGLPLKMFLLQRGLHQ